MSRFLLLVTPEDTPAEATSPGGLGRRAQAVLDWLDELRRRDRIGFGALLDTASDRIERDAGGRATWRPGAPIRLCFVVEAKSREAILDVAARCPFETPGTIDVLALEAALERAEPARVHP